MSDCVYHDNKKLRMSYHDNKSLQLLYHTINIIAHHYVFICDVQYCTQTCVCTYVCVCVCMCMCVCMCVNIRLVIKDITVPSPFIT